MGLCVVLFSTDRVINETDKVPAFVRELVIWRERERRKEGRKEGRSKERMKENLPIYGEREREFRSALKKNVEVSKDRQWSRNAREADDIFFFKCI